MDFAVAVLTFTTRLTLVHALRVDRVAEGFPVSDLRSADIGFHFEFAKESGRR